MKKLFFIIITSLFVWSCDNAAKEENERLKREQEELLAASKKDNGQISSISAEMEKVYAQVDSMREMQDKIRSMASKMRGGEINAADGGASIDETFAKLEKTLANNQKQLASLENKLKKTGQENAMLSRMIDELKKTLGEKEQQVNELQGEITRLQGEVEGWKSQYALAEYEKGKNQTELDNAQDNLNVAYYVIGTKKELEDKGIISRKGLFKGKVAGLSSSISNDKLTQIDVRYKDRILVGNKEILEVLPQRANASYKIDDKSGEKTIVISEPKSFWENKYLVIVVK